jgi:hypothetical protein
MNVAPLTRALQETLAALDEEINAAQARVEELKLERQGVHAALKRFASEPSPPQPSTDRSRPPLARPVPTYGEGLSERVLSLLRGADAPVSVNEIVDSTGLTKDQVRSALGYLKRRGDIERVSRGLWLPTSPTEPDAAPAATTGAASGSIHPTTNGGGASGTDSHRVRDDDLLSTADHRVHDHGAPVVGAE